MYSLEELKSMPKGKRVYIVWDSNFSFLDHDRPLPSQKLRRGYMKVEEITSTTLLGHEICWIRLESAKYQISIPGKYYEIYFWAYKNKRAMQLEMML